MTKEEIGKIIDKVINNYLYLNRQKDGEKEQLIKSYIDELKDYDFEAVTKAINKISQTSKYAPSVAEIKVKINQEKEDDNNINWNSCYWFEIEKEWCDKHNEPYYDITNGKVLQPFKE